MSDTSTAWLNYGPTWRTTYRAGCDRWLSVHLDSLHRWRWSMLTDDGERACGVCDTEQQATAAAERALLLPEDPMTVQPLEVRGDTGFRG
jgi:hypothetical protein